MALGATRAHIASDMVVHALRTGMIDAGAGVLLAFVMSRAASSMLEFIPAFGLRPYLVAGPIVLGASVIAAWLPTAGAARMDPATALRAE